MQIGWVVAHHNSFVWRTDKLQRLVTIFVATNFACIKVEGIILVEANFLMQGKLISYNKTFYDPVDLTFDDALDLEVIWVCGSYWT